MGNLNVEFSSYNIGSDAIKYIPEICLKYGDRAVVIGGEKALNASKEKISSATSASGLSILDYIHYGSDCTISNANRLVDAVQKMDADMIIGVGGGKALDTAKIVAVKVGIPFFAIPTIASTCSAVTKLSVVYDDNGVFDSFYYFDTPPIHAFIDSDIIAGAPVKYLWAGMGDTIAKHYECTLSSRGDRLDHSSGMGIEISSMCVKHSLEYGIKALDDCAKEINSFDVEQIILNNIISTGMVSVLIEDKYNGAVAHSLFYGLTLLEHIEKYHLHGEVVAYGVLVQLALDKQFDELKKLYEFYKSVKFPVSLKELEIENNRDILNEVLKSTISGPDMEYLPYSVTEDMIFDAIQQVESLS